MKVKNPTPINNTPSFHGRASLGKRFAQSMSKFDQFGEGTNISIDFLGKAILVPAVIMGATNEPKEKKQYSAIKNPIAAFIQLALEVPILYFGTKLIGKYANKGKLDKAGSEFSYNEKAAKDNFLKIFENTSNIEKERNGLIEKINKKGLTKRLTDELDEVVTKANSSALKKGFESYKASHKRLYHLQNRLCFAAALVLTPALCALENWAHPKVMDKFFPKKKSNAMHYSFYQSRSTHPGFHRFEKMLNPTIKKGGPKCK